MNKKFEGTLKEKFFFHNTLLVLVKALQGQNVTVDLRNDSYICGCITSVDGYMNISFSNAVYCDPQGNEFLFESLFILSRNIRYFNIPEKMPIIPTIKKELFAAQYKPIQNPTAKSRKVKKAMLQHMKTVASLNVTPQ